LLGAKNHDITLAIYFGNEEELLHFKPFFATIENVKLNFLKEYRVPDFWNSYLLNMTADAIMYLNDDVELFEDTLDVVLEEFPAHFPDYDGVMGLNQINIKDVNKVESAFGVIGSKYAERFPNKQVWCPAYSRFYGDWELWKYAKEINRFYFCEYARINHFHPSLNREWEDSTHNDVRKFLQEDKKMFRQRQTNNLLWGKSYAL